METLRIIYHHEGGSWWAESPDLDPWYAAGDTYAEVVKLAEEGIPFALGHNATLEHYVSAGERVPA
jgi:predicted RNase H-like HicB family nuclease